MCHDFRNIRDLTAQGLQRLTKKDPEYMAKTGTVGWCLLWFNISCFLHQKMSLSEAETRKFWKN